MIMAYDSGITLTEKSSAFIPDPANYFASIAKEDGEGYPSVLAGQPALITPPNAADGAKGSVQWVKDGTLVAVIGDGKLGVGQLLDYANSVASVS